MANYSKKTHIPWRISINIIMETLAISLKTLAHALYTFLTSTHGVTSIVAFFAALTSFLVQKQKGWACLIQLIFVSQFAAHILSPLIFTLVEAYTPIIFNEQSKMGVVGLLSLTSWHLLETVADGSILNILSKNSQKK